MKVNGYFILNGEVQSLHITDLKRGLNYVKFERARPHGEWIKSDNKYKGEWKCSVCEKYASFYNNPYKDKSDFCPNCGADMRKEGDNK